MWLLQSNPFRYLLSLKLIVKLIFFTNKKFCFCYSGSDDVQRSIELLDRVLSEFDDVENANQVQNVSIDLSKYFLSESNYQIPNNMTFNCTFKLKRFATPSDGEWFGLS